MAKDKNMLDGFEWNEVLPKQQFFDVLERRFFLNGLSHPIKIGFGHNARRLEIIAIIESDGKDSELKAFEGKTITEE
jgi:hypothetical protein